MENGYPNFDTLCRLCLQEVSDPSELVDIFEYNDSQQQKTPESSRASTRIKIISVVALIEPRINDNLPKAICKECCFVLEQAYVFRKKAIASDAKLRKHYRLLSMGKRSKVFEKEEDNELEDELEFGESLAYLKEEKRLREERMRERILAELREENAKELQRSLLKEMGKEKQKLKNAIYKRVSQELEPKLREQITRDLRESLQAEETTLLLKDLEEFLSYKRGKLQDIINNESSCDDNVDRNSTAADEGLMQNNDTMRVDQGVNENLKIGSIHDLVVVNPNSIPGDYESEHSTYGTSNGVEEFQSNSCANSLCDANISIFNIKAEGVPSVVAASQFRSTPMSYQIQDNGEIRLNNVETNNQMMMNGTSLNNVIQVLDCNNGDNASCPSIYKDDPVDAGDEETASVAPSFQDTMELVDFIDKLEEPAAEPPVKKKRKMPKRSPSKNQNVPIQHKTDVTGRRQTITPKLFKCKQCPVECSTKLVLDRHMNSHRKVNGNTYDCPECAITLSCKSALNRHMVLHTGEKPFTCEECNKSFRQKEVLLRHQEIHKNIEDRRHKCSECHQAFAQKISLTQHINRYHMKNPLVVMHGCSLCGKEFQYSSGLSRHLASHSGVGYECMICFRTFGDRSSSKRHVAHLHSVSDSESALHIREVLNANKNDLET